MRRGGALKTIVDVFVQVDRAERVVRRRHRDLLAMQREYARHENFLNAQREQEVARYEVEEFECRVQELLSVHHECTSPIDWQQIASSPQPHIPPPQVPPPPTLMLPAGSYAAQAEQQLATYKPSLVDRMFNRTARVQQEIEATLAQARAMDAQARAAAEQEYNRNHSLWSQHAAQIQGAWQQQQQLAISRWQQTVALARGVLSGDPHAYTTVLQQSRCLTELDEKGCAPEGNWLGKHAAEVLLAVDASTDLVPTERKSLTAGGKLSVKKMAAKESVAIYQDFVCGTAIRAARELTAVLPLRGVLVEVLSPVVNRTTGQMDLSYILSAYFPREALFGRDFSRIDASDFVESMLHSMKLKKGVGMDEISPLEVERFLQANDRVTPW